MMKMVMLMWMVISKKPPNRVGARCQEADAPQTGSAGCAHVDRTHLGRGPQDLKMAQYDKTSVPFLCFLIRLLDTIYYIKTQMPNPVLKLRELPCEPPPAYHPHMPRLHQWTLCLKSPKAELTFSLKSFHCKHSFLSALVIFFVHKLNFTIGMGWNGLRWEFLWLWGRQRP